MRQWASHEKGITKPESGEKIKRTEKGRPVECGRPVEKKIVQKKQYWWLSEVGLLTPANPFPTGGGSAAGRSRVTPCTASRPWARAEERAVLDHGGWLIVWHEMLVPGWDTKSKSSVLSMHQSSFRFHFSRAGCGTCFSTQILTRWFIFFPFSVHSVLLCGGKAFCAAECL